MEISFSQIKDLLKLALPFIYCVPIYLVINMVVPKESKPIALSSLISLVLLMTFFIFDDIKQEILGAFISTSTALLLYFLGEKAQQRRFQSEQERPMIEETEMMLHILIKFFRKAVKYKEIHDKYLALNENDSINNHWRNYESGSDPDGGWTTLEEGIDKVKASRFADTIPEQLIEMLALLKTEGEYFLSGCTVKDYRVKRKPKVEEHLRKLKEQGEAVLSKLESLNPKLDSISIRSLIDNM